MAAYSKTGTYMAQKYFGSPSRKMNADKAQQIFGLDADGKPSYSVPLSNFVNYQVNSEQMNCRRRGTCIQIDPVGDAFSWRQFSAVMFL